MCQGGHHARSPPDRKAGRFSGPVHATTPLRAARNPKLRPALLRRLFPGELLDHSQYPNQVAPRPLIHGGRNSRNHGTTGQSGRCSTTPKVSTCAPRIRLLSFPANRTSTIPPFAFGPPIVRSLNAARGMPHSLRTGRAGSTTREAVRRGVNRRREPDIARTQKNEFTPVLDHRRSVQDSHSSTTVPDHRLTSDISIGERHELPELPYAQRPKREFLPNVRNNNQDGPIRWRCALRGFGPGQADDYCGAPRRWGRN